MYIIAKEGKIHAFGSSGARENLGLLAILSERKYPAWLKEGAVLEQKADKVLSDELCKALRECGGEEEKYFTVGAATYIIKKSEKNLAKWGVHDDCRSGCRGYFAGNVGSVGGIQKNSAECTAGHSARRVITTPFGFWATMTR